MGLLQVLLKYWPRYWLVATIVLVVCWSPLFVIMAGESLWGTVELGLLLIGAPSAAIFALLWGGAWIQRRFQSDTGSRQVVSSPGVVRASEAKTMPTVPVRPSASMVQVSADSTPPGKDGDRNLSGVRGWLLGFCLVLTIIAPLYLIVGIAEEFDVGKTLSDRVPGLHLLVQLEAVVPIVLLIFSSYAGYLMWAVKPRAVLTAKIFLGAMFLVTLFAGPVLGLVAGVDDNSMAILWNRVPNSAPRAALWFLPLYGYLRLSKRVRATYGPA